MDESDNKDQHCSTDDCDNSPYARGLCKKHYNRYRYKYIKQAYKPSSADRELIAKLRAFKRTRGLTLGDIGTLLGISAAYLSHIICFVVRVTDDLRPIIEALGRDQKPKSQDYSPLKTRRLNRAANPGFEKALRAAGISQAELARRLDTNPVHLSCIRHELFSSDNYQTHAKSYWASLLVRIADELDVPVISLASPKSIDLLFSRDALWDRAIEADCRMTLPDPAEEVAEQEEVETILSRFDERSRVLVSLYYGLTNDVRSRTLEEVGEIFGTSRERIRQLIEIALESGRHGHKRRILRRCSWCGLQRGRRLHNYCRKQKLKLCGKLIELGIRIEPPLSPVSDTRK